MLEYTGLQTRPRDGAILEEAAKLAADGELGNSDAIRLLQLPHSREDLRTVLERFAPQLSREARSKLTLEALVPQPAGVDNQRFEPLFDKYIVTGNTYTTASGIVVPDELQYYNGQMVHVHAECSNVSAVNQALAASGYRAMTLRYESGREAAIAQLWSSRFTDCTLGPYSAMFIVVVVVPETASPEESVIRADPGGASSVLAMLDGVFDAERGVYTNRARIFLVRLIDTTQAAIDVGRERMGTDKRPGSIDMARIGRSIRLSIRDSEGHDVVGGVVELADDSATYLASLATAARTAGIPLGTFPPGTEFVYPAVARIGRGPVVSWQWRSDMVPRLQPALPNAIAFGSDSEEGRLLATWGFTPRGCGYFGNVRGLITGLLPDPSARRAVPSLAASSAALLVPVTPAASNRAKASYASDARRYSVPQPESERYGAGAVAPSRGNDDAFRASTQDSDVVTRRASDGTLISWGTKAAPAPPRSVAAGAMVPVTVAVNPIKPGHAVTVDYRVNGGPLLQAAALPDLAVHGVGGRLFRAALPALTDGIVEFVPVLRFAGQPISPRLGASPDSSTCSVGRCVQPVRGDSPSASPAPARAGNRQPLWSWDATFLGTLDATLRQERVGVTPDGLRINWHVVEGRFVGPEFELRVLPGAADWMRIRQDGVGIVNVEACFETPSGARINGSYSGHFDLGRDGYARALRNDYDPLPPVVVTPTYATADERFEWLNRAQCLGVGRVDMKALRVQFDVYIVRVGPRAAGAPGAETRSAAVPSDTLYARMGGYDVIAAMADDFIAWIVADDRLSRLFVTGYTDARIKVIRQHVVDLLCQLTGGPCVYTGRDMKTAHKGLGIDEADWKTASDLLIAALTKYRVGPQEQREFMQIIEDMKADVIEYA